VTGLASLIWSMRPRDPAEPHRVATCLELLFNLTFGVAVVRAAAQLAEAIGEGRVGHGLLGYVTMSFAIW
jgi:low temperature requirement protein LtrA